MRIIISPAKKMVADTDSFAVDGLPVYLERTERLKTALQGMSPAELQALWKCNDAIAKLNIERLEQMDLRRNLTPAILLLRGHPVPLHGPRRDGDSPPGLPPGASAHPLRVLWPAAALRRRDALPAGDAGQASGGRARDLYGFWGDALARRLAAETDFVLNLASKEYSRAVEPHLPKSVRFLTCAFGEWKDGKIVEKGTMCKMARGQMVRWLAENNVTNPADIRAFDQLGYRFQPELSSENHDVFLKSST